MTFDEWLAGTPENLWDWIRLLRREQKEADERATAKYHTALLAASVAALLPLFALCFADPSGPVPWATFVSVGMVYSGVVQPLWKAYFIARSREQECQRKIHEVMMLMAWGAPNRI